jgi:hypothetical protein
MRRLVILLLAMSLLLPACSAGAIRDIPGKVVKRFRPAASSTPLASQTATRLSGSTVTPAAIASAASSPATQAAVSTPTQAAASAKTAAPTAKATAAPTAGPARVTIFLVALGDNGGSGQKIGCGDSLIPVEREAPATQEVLRAALEQLLSQHDRFYGESGLYNALYQSDLKVESFTVESGTATVRLTGTLTSGGVCDSPRILQQLTQTAIQPHLSIAREAKIFVNGKPLETLLSGK